jgi:beta-lactamase regulating signal transducer with metallopeptidase domain
MTAPDVQALAQVFTERLLNSAAAGILLAGLVYLLLRMVGRQNSGTRFAIWFSALLAMVAFPFFSGSVFYSSRIHLLSSAAQKGEIVLSSSWAAYLFVAWGAVAAILLFRIAVGLWRVCEVRRNCTEIEVATFDPGVAKRIGEIFRTSTSRRRVKLCVSDEVSVPSAIGLFRAAIVFPDWLLPQLSAGEIEMIVRHELAHLQRWDDWTNLVQKIVRALLFFHPAVWWIENRLTLEREMACDDMVLAQTGSPRAYASSLISFAEKLHSARGLALAQALVSRMHEMSVRLAQILDAKRTSRIGLWKPVLGLSAGLLVFAFGAAPYMPRVVAFESRPNRGEQAALQANAALNLQAAGQGSVDAHMSRAIAQPVALRGDFVSQPGSQKSSLPSSQPRLIQAVFHPRAAKAAGRLKTATPKKPLILRTSAADEALAPAQPATYARALYIPTLYILQTSEYSAPTASSPGVWTFCIWKIDANNPAERQLESAIVVSWI